MLTHGGSLGTATVRERTDALTVTGHRFSLFFQNVPDCYLDLVPGPKIRGASVPRPAEPALAIGCAKIQCPAGVALESIHYKFRRHGGAGIDHGVNMSGSHVCGK